MTNPIGRPIGSCGRCVLGGSALHLNRDCPVHGALAGYLATNERATLPGQLVRHAETLEQLGAIGQAAAETLQSTFRELHKQLRRLRPLRITLPSFQLPQCTGPRDAPLRPHWPGSSATCAVCLSLPRKPAGSDV